MKIKQVTVEISNSLGEAGAGNKPFGEVWIKKVVPVRCGRPNIMIDDGETGHMPSKC